MKTNNQRNDMRGMQRIQDQRPHSDTSPKDESDFIFHVSHINGPNDGQSPIQRPLPYQIIPNVLSQPGPNPEDEDDDEDLYQLVPDEMDYTHEDSFKYLEMRRQGDEQKQLL